MKLWILALLLTTACQVPPAWMPGDPPLSFHTTDDRIWTAIRQACESGAMASGWRRRAADRMEATVFVTTHLTDLSRGVGIHAARSGRLARGRVGA